MLPVAAPPASPIRAVARRVWFPLILAAAVALIGLPGLAFPRAVRAAEEVPAANDSRAGAYAQGRARFEVGDFAGAAERFAAAREADPQRSLYAQWLGRALGLQARDAPLLRRPGLAGRSRESLERAVALDPANLGARSDLAAFYAAAPSFLGGGMAKAREQVEQIRRRDPYLGVVRAGDLSLDEDGPAAAEERYNAAVRLDGRRPDARFRLAYLATRGGDYGRAFEQYDAVLATDPAEPGALFGLGRTADLSGQRLAEGEAALRRYLLASPRVTDPSYGPTPAKARFRLGNLLARRGERAAARVEYETALRLDPKLEDARRALAGLR